MKNEILFAKAYTELQDYDRALSACNLTRETGAAVVAAYCQAISNPLPEWAKGDTSKRRFRLVPAAALEYTPANWLIENYLTKKSLSEVFGDPGGLKTFIAMAAGLGIATKTSFFGFDVTGGPVVYICGEGQGGIRKRLEAWAKDSNIPLADIPFYVSTMPTALIEPVILHETIQAIAEDLPEPPVLVIIDTLNRNMGPGDENNAVDMTAFIQAADKIRNDFDTAVLIVHHSGHSAKDRSRGHSALKAALDFEYRATKDVDGVVRFECTKIKDYETPEPLAFKSEVIPLDDGETSIVLRRIAFEPPPVQGKAGRGKWQTVALQVLSELTEKYRKNLEDAGHDPDTARVSLNDWKDACRFQNMPRPRMNEAINSLIKGGAVRNDFGFVERI